MHISEAATMLQVEESTLREFDVVDHFQQPPMDLRGYLCVEKTKNFGALVISHVDNKPVPQVVYGTPKMHYPFDRNKDADAPRRYRFPDVRDVRVYEKWDGTNILAYSYADAQGYRYVTYKARQAAVLDQDNSIDFFGLWKEILSLHTSLILPPRVLSGELALAFELYGERCRHDMAVHYNTELDTVLLFGICQKTGGIMLPHEAGTDIPTSLWCTCEAELREDEDLQHFYEAMRCAAEVSNTGKKGEDGIILAGGTEGYMFYCRDAETGFWTPYKCKPPSIEALHWATGGVPQDIVTQVAWEALEQTTGKLTVSMVRERLLQSFPEFRVTTAVTRIEKAVAQVNQSIEFRAQVHEAYVDLGIPYNGHNRSEIMRAMSQRFGKQHMKGVFQALQALSVFP